MDFLKMLNKHSNSLKPSKAQYRRVYNRVFPEFTEDSKPNLILTIVDMITNIFKVKAVRYALPVIALFTFIAVPLGYTTIMSSPPLRSLQDNAASDPAGFVSSRNPLLELLDGDDSDEKSISKIREESQLDADYYYQQPVITAPEETATAESNRVKDQDAYLLLESRNVRENFNKIKDLILKTNGYIVSSNFSGAEGEQTGSIIMRVPADKFDSTLQEIRDMDLDIVTENINITDKQNEYTQVTKEIESFNTKIAELEAKIANEKDAAKKASMEIDLNSMKSLKEMSDKKLEGLNKETLFSTIEVKVQGKQSIIGGSFGDLPAVLAEIVSFWIVVIAWLAIPLTVTTLIYVMAKKLNRKIKVS